jgi:putative transposase
LKQAKAGTGVPDVCCEQFIGSATFYTLRAKYVGMDVSLMSRVKAQEEENQRLK